MARFCLLIALPAALRRTLTRDRGIEMAAHADITSATGVQVYFAGPHSAGSAPAAPADSTRAGASGTSTAARR
jgi:hypothetical protein